MENQTRISSALLPILEPLQEKIPSMQSRVASSAFDGSDRDLRAIPLPLDWRWPSITTYLQTFGAETLLLQVPSFWQIEPFVFYATRNAEASLAIYEPQDYTLDKAAILYAGADTVLAESSEADAILSFLKKEHVTLPNFIILHRADAESWSTPHSLHTSGVRIAHEVHLTPGVPLLVQCEHLARSGEPAFHLSEHFLWHSDLSKPTITTSPRMLFTFVDFTLPFALKQNAVCVCGKKTVERTEART